MQNPPVYACRGGKKDPFGCLLGMRDLRTLWINSRGKRFDAGKRCANPFGHWTYTREGDLCGPLDRSIKMLYAPAPPPIGVEAGG